jgi:hypothetical protein
MHELLIGFLIVAIVAIQIYIFSITLEKIKIFKNILPNKENFKTVKVYLKESEIESISLVNIYKNLPEYSNKDRNKNNKNNDSNFEEVEKINHEYSKYETVDDTEECEYVEKDGIQTKIKSKNLDLFLSKGWKIIDISPLKEILSSKVALENQKVNSLQNEETIFYKHAPHESGYFDVENNVTIADAVFKFSINKNNPHLASFEILKINTKRLILDYPNKYIKPICDELNTFNKNAVDIIVTPGQVEKIENKWVIKTKAQIKYI